MAYGLFLYKEFASKSNKTIRLEIFQKDYAGISAEIESMGGSPLVLVSDNANSSVYLPIVKSYLDISIVDTNQVDYSVFFTPDATKFKVIVKVNGTPEWSGYLTPDSFEQDLRFKGDISLTARDNLGMLSEFDYDLTNSFYSITTLIDTALTKIGFQFTLEYRINKVDSLNETIRNGLTQSKFWIGKTWQEVLETILTGMGCQMRYVGDNKFAIYDIGYLSSLGTPHTPQTFSFIEQGGNQEIIPAWKVLTINQDYGLGDNIYDGFVEQSNYDFYAYRGGDVDNPYNFYLRPFYTIPLSSDWVSTIPMLSPYEYPNIDPNNLYITGKSPENTLFMSSKLIYGKYFEAISDGKAIQFKFKANNYPHYITQRRSGEYMVGAMLRARYLYTMKVRCNLFAQTATEKYVLQGQRWIPWTISYDDALEFNLPQTKESSVYGKQGTELTSQMDSPQDQDITIEAYGLGESANVWIEFYPYTATYTEVDGLGAVDDYPAIVFDVHTMKLSGFELRIVENEIGGLESKVTINANHNINGAVDLSLGEVPSGLGGYHTYLAGIFKNSHPYYPPMTGFHFTGGTNYKLSELIGREVAHHYKTQKNKLSGTIINSLNFAAMPSFGKTFTDGVKNYALNYGALDFRNETMQVELIEVEDYATDDFTFIDAEIDTGGGESLGSGETEFIQWSAAGNAKRIYELDTASEADQAGAFVFIDKSGLSAAKKVPISSLLVDAYTKTESDSRFASIDGDLTQDFSAKKLTTATLLLPQTAPILASGEVAIYSLDSGFSGEVPSGAGSVTSVALTMPTGFSVSGSPITESGTFGVTFASGYFLPTTTQFASKADVSLIGAANGIAPLDSGGKVALQYLPSTLLKYMGVWDASTNTPTLLATDTNRKGQVWNVSVAGTQFGIAFKLGDWLIYNDSGVAEKSDNSDDVTSVNGYTGAVTLKTSDIAEQTNLYYTDARVKAYSDLNYLGISAKAADSDKLDGIDSGGFLRKATTANADYWNQGNTFVVDWAGALPDNLSGVYNYGIGFILNTTIGLANAEFYIPENNGGISGDLYYRTGYGTTKRAWLKLWHSGNLLNIGTTASSARTALELGSAALKSDTYFALLAGSISQPFSASKLTSTTLLLPQSAPTLVSGEMAIYGLESGFSGELPSGAGSVTSISMVVPTGLAVTPTTITESGTFTISYASGYQMMTSFESSKLAGIEANANNYTLPTATNLVLGGVKIGSNITITDGVISVAAPYTLPTATASVLGGVKIGTNVTITDGVISVHNPVTLGTANGLSLSTQILSLALATTTTSGAMSSSDKTKLDGIAANANNYTLPLAANGTRGGIQIGFTATGASLPLLLSSEKAYITLTKSAVENVLTGAITSHTHAFADLTNKPTTLSGYGVLSTDTLFDGKYLRKATTANADYWNQGNTFVVDWAGALPDNLSGVYNYGIGFILNTTIGLANAEFYIPENNGGISGDLYYRTGYGTTKRAWLKLWHSGNSNLTTIDWSAKNLTLNGSISGVTTLSASGIVSLTNTTQSTAYTNGGLVLSGGLGIAKDLYSNGKAVFASSVQMSENINTNLRIPKVAPTSPTSGQYYFYIVE